MTSKLIIEPLDDTLRAHLMALPGYIVLVRKPGDNAYIGLVEGSFSLDTSRDRTQFFWSSDNATSNFGGKFKIDGYADAKHRVDSYRKLSPDWIFEIFDARDDELLPVVLDWENWLLDNRSANNLSGVANKYGARNIRFTAKDAP